MDARVPDEMALFAAQLRPTLVSADDLPLLRAVLAAAADRLARHGRIVRCINTSYRPGDGRWVCVFAASSIESVREVLAAANVSTIRLEPGAGGIDLDRVTEEA